jgi:hypothetical protein
MSKRPCAFVVRSSGDASEFPREPALFNDEEEANLYLSQEGGVLYSLYDRAGYEPMGGAAGILEQAADTYRERNAEYGENYRVFGRVMDALFPDGLTIKGVDEWNRFHLWLLSVVKLTRYVQNWEAGHEDSILDEIVYLAMTLQLDRERAHRRSAEEEQREATEI